MGNRRKTKRPWLSIRNQRDPKRIERVKKALAAEGDIRPGISGRLRAEQVDIPEDEKELLKIVDAEVNGQRIGDALLYSDGSVDIKIDDGADPGLIQTLRGELTDFNAENDSTLTGKDIGLDI